MAQTRVMLVDDNEADLLYSRIVLERGGLGCEVLSFDDARAALAVLREDDGPGIQLVLLDINMPGMDGFEFLAAYAPWAATRPGAARVVMLTSSSDPRDRARAEAHAVVCGYLIKPLDTQALARLRPLLETARG